MVQQSDIEKLRRVITRGKYGSVYFASSFTGFNTEYVSKLLAGFEKEGLIVRISKGVYMKAKKTKFGTSYPPVESIVREIARRDKAKIIPTGETAANMLGLSEQVPTKTCFLTTGTYRNLRIGNQTILLKNSAPKNFEYHNRVVNILVQALRSIGEKNVTEETKSKIPGILRDVARDKHMEADMALAPAWIRRIIREMI